MRNPAICLFIILFSSSLSAETFRARIVESEGQVYVVNGDGEKRTPDRKKFLVNENETIVTEKNSQAVVQFDDGVMSVVDEESELLVEKNGWLSQLGGKVYYIFRKVIGKSERKKVKTRFATIGIRGTTFIVDANDLQPQIALKEGNLNIQSPDDRDYELRQKKPEDDFAAYRQRVMQQQQAMQDEFRAYKQQIAREFIEYRKSFDIHANQVVSFDNRKVSQSTLDTNWQKDFDRFNRISSRYSRAYRDLEEAVESLDEDVE